MEGLIKAVESVLSILFMIGIGYFLTHKKWINEESSGIFVKLVTSITLPFLMFYTIVTRFTREKLFESPIGLVIPFIAMLICYLIGRILCKVINVKDGRRGLFTSMFFNSNTIFMGLPINVAIFGEESIPYVLLYYIGNSTLFWTIGVLEIGRDNREGVSKSINGSVIKKILSPPLMGYLIGIVFVILNIHTPGFLLDSFSKVGNMTTPLSMIFIGVTMYAIKLKDMKLNREIIGVLLGRFFICPIITMILCDFFNVPLLMKSVFVIQAAMPVMTNTAIVAKSYKVDSEYAAISIWISTLMSLIVIPFYMLIL